MCPLQYDSTTNKLLYASGFDGTGYNNKLMAECLCGDENIYYFACCMPTYLDPLFPQLLIITAAKYTALGSPACVYYTAPTTEFLKCMYVFGGQVGCDVNVDPDDVTASPYSSCDDAWDKADCPSCFACAPCTFGETPSYVNVTIVGPRVNMSETLYYYDYQDPPRICYYSSNPGHAGMVKYIDMFWGHYSIFPEYTTQVTVHGKEGVPLTFGNYV
jgi:hypothetical protein